MLVPKCAVGWNMGMRLNGLSLEDKSNSEKEDKQVSRVIWFIWLSQVVNLQTIWSFDTLSSFI